MQAEVRTPNSRSRRQPPFECVALLLQGGGALGAYQAGVYEALAEAGIHPNWVAGISIGAINSAIIVGNPPNKRVERLREFWDGVTANIVGDLAHHLFNPLVKGDWQRGLMSQFSAGLSTAVGAPGFFAPRPASPFAYPSGAIEATSFYDTTNLKGHSRAARRLRSHKFRKRSLERRRRECSNRKFRLLRYCHAQDPA